MVASQTADLPLPSIQLMAAGFLSVQKFPLTATTCSSGKCCCSRLSACSVPCRHHTHERSKPSAAPARMPSSLSLNLETWTYLRDHIHSHGISRRGVKADVKIPPCKSNQQPLQTSKPADKSCVISPNPSVVLSVDLDLPAGVVESLFDGLKAVAALQPGSDLGGSAG